ncbi:MAG: class E sortase [Actinomycetia bacterium]|nr:class E sortase [Actinomycetes bacterium]
MGNAVRVVVRTIGELLITAGVVLMLFLVWQLWWTDVVADRAQAETVAELSAIFETEPPPPPPAPEEPEEPGITAMVPTGEAFAIVRIPRFGDDYARPIIEGTDLDVLEKGVGHYVGTAMPGEVGNFAIAGHRTTYGRPFHFIHELQPGDPIVIETAEAYTIYEMRRHQIVFPTETRVIAPVPDEPAGEPSEAWLTMTSCHPIYGSRERYIVHAELTETIARESGVVPDRVAEILRG